MERRTIDPRRVDLTALIERGTELHGHTGPFLVAGIRMGLLALEHLKCPGYFGLRAESEAGSLPPVSCLTDGVQIGSGCTTGKGNLSVSGGGRPQARFETGDGRAVTIALRPEVEAAFRGDDAEALAQRARAASLEELFTWKIEPSS